MGKDERGSVISITDSSGALLNINRYDEYGKPQSTNTGRFQYTGQMWLSELGAYYYKARVYLPHLGIFAQTDPIGYEDSPNLYAYVGNDPVNLEDPFGLGNDCGGDCTPIPVVGSRLGGSSDLTSAALQMTPPGSRVTSQAACDECSGDDEIDVIGTRLHPVAPPPPEDDNGVTGPRIVPLPGAPAERPIIIQAGFRKGERNWAGKRSGTPNPFKGLRPGKKEGWVKYRDPQSGKWVERPGTAEELNYLATRGPSLYDIIGAVLPLPVALGMCLIAPVTCGVLDTNHNGVIDEDEIF